MYFTNEKGYLSLLKITLENGERKETRNGIVYSNFGRMIHFDNIYDKFPLITTKKMFFRGVVEELLWFLRGSTNANELKEKNIHIWDGNSSREYLDSMGLTNYTEGELGPVYGWQWRNFGKDYELSKESLLEKESDIEGEYELSKESLLEKESDIEGEYDLAKDSDIECGYEFERKGKDQIKYVIEELLKKNSRRAVLSAWNPVDLERMALPPCHILYIFNNTNSGLCCHMTLRSSDLFLGLPFNIASTALLTQIIAHILHVNASEICLSICDAHIYEEHFEQVKKQVVLEPYALPKLIIKKEAPLLESSIDDKMRWIESLVYEDFELTNYKSHASLKAVMK
jgi:thymidylate synthase